MTATTTLEELFQQLEAAVHDKDHEHALELEGEIQQHLALLADDLAAQELRLRALMARVSEVVETPPTKLGIELPRPPRRPRGGLMGYVGGIDLEQLQPFDIERSVEPAEEEQGVDYPVWFGTNRKPATGGGFTGERHDQITRGRVMIHVPKAFQFGEGPWSLLKLLLPSDDQLLVKRIETQAQDVFYASVRKAIAAARDAGTAPQALLFLHGYNNSFEEAAIRAAQIGYDLKIPGPTAFFSWPSLGDLKKYPADEASIEGSERAITDFLVEFSQNCGTETIHIIAHSMGNRGLLRALERIAADAAMRGKLRFNQIILAAPDVDRDLFLSLAHLYAGHAQRTTLYASNADIAAHLSAKLHGAPRAGYFTPYTVTAGVDTVMVPNFNVDLLGHSYFAKAEALLSDMWQLVHHNEPPSKRQRIMAMSDDGANFWRIR